MKYEVLKRSHLKRNIIIAVLVVSLISSLILNFTRAKYRTTQSMPLIQGTINFSPSDLNLMAVYLNRNGETISSDKVPHVGYTLNTEQSICEVNDVEDENIEIVYENGLLNFNGLGNKGTKCTAYFDLIPDDQAPTVNIATSSSDDTSVTVTANASDNIGIYYYYYKLDNGEEIQSIDATYTFTGLEKDSVHTITVRVEDAAGNEASATDEVTVGLRAGDVILASANPPTGQTTDWTGETTYYYTGNPNNWVQFGGFWWRIIRINGDGTIRMIYQGTNANVAGSGTQIEESAFNSSTSDNMYVGYMYTSGQRQGHDDPSTIKGILDTWYQNNLANEADYIDGNAGFCGDRRVSSGSGTGTSETDYQPCTRISNSSPSLTCQTEDIYTISGSSTGNKSLTYPIGLLTADEYELAGSGNNYLNTRQTYWTMSPYGYGRGAGVYLVIDDGFLTDGLVNSTRGVRPVINLKSSILLEGDGSVNTPFKIVGT